MWFNRFEDPDCFLLIPSGTQNVQISPGVSREISRENMTTMIMVTWCNMFWSIVFLIYIYILNKCICRWVALVSSFACHDLPFSWGHEEIHADRKMRLLIMKDVRLGQLMGRAHHWMTVGRIMRLGSPWKQTTCGEPRIWKNDRKAMSDVSH